MKWAATAGVGVAGVVVLPILVLVAAGGLPGLGRGPGPSGAGGDTRLAWAEAFTAELGATSDSALKFALAWATAEGAPPEANNPLDSSLPLPGSALLPGNGDGIRMYPTLAAGLAADVATIADANPAFGYQPLIDALRQGDVGAAAAALQHSSWCNDPAGPGGHECPGYGAGIQAIVDSYADPIVFEQAGGVKAGTTLLPAPGSTGEAAASPAAPKAGYGSVPTLLSWLQARLGQPYVWGGTGPQGYDCSGLTMMAFASIGVPLPRTAAEQYSATARVAVPLADAQPGDLVFWAYRASDPTTIHHVAVYVGAGRIIEAATEGVPIHEVPIWNDGGLLPVATRPLALASPAL